MKKTEQLKIKSMNLDYVKQICSWNYPDEYQEYNFPSYEKVVSSKYNITNPLKADNYICFVLNDDFLFAYMNIISANDDSVFIGIGIKPEECGKGYGKDILLIGIKEILKRYPNRTIDLKVRSWNKRAIKCYQNCNFKIIKDIEEIDHNNNKVEFIYMQFKEDNK